MNAKVLPEVDDAASGGNAVLGCPDLPEAPLRIALLVESTSGGVGRHVIDLAIALCMRGHSIDLIYSGRRIDSRFSDGLARLVSLGARTHEIEMRHGIHPADLSSIIQIRKYLQTNGPFDILHTHSTKGGFVGRLAALGLNCRTIYTPHGLVTNAPFRSRTYQLAAGWLERGLANLGDAVFCVSDDEKKNAVELGFPESKLFVVQNGIDLDEAEQCRDNRLNMRRRLSLNEADTCVGFVARMIAGKGPGILLESFAIRSRGSDDSAKLVFVGDGPERAVLQQRIEQLQLQEHVVLAGELNGLAAMAAFDIFVLPSMSEAFPYVIVEALAMGLPVISTDVGGATTLVRDGMNGFIVPKSSPQAMAIALEQLLKSADLRNAMGAASRQLARRFSLERMVEQTESIYRDLLLPAKS